MIGMETIEVPEELIMGLQEDLAIMELEADTPELITQNLVGPPQEPPLLKAEYPAERRDQVEKVLAAVRVEEVLENNQLS